MFASLRRIDTSVVEEQGHISRISVRRDIYHQRQYDNVRTHSQNTQ
jgi:hypothetical protein